jgi:Methylene-tetrahydromethanopterin dehydrogenase, N-terminal.
MSKKSILHMFDPMPHNSPFDVNMAVDAGFDIIMPYNNVNFEDTQRLVQDAIFSRGPKGVKQTAILSVAVT